MRTEKRHDGRNYNELRPLRVSYDLYGYGDSSLLLQIGNTKVLCSVSLQPGVPGFLRGKNTGWLSAEYAMLPTATMVRKQRETTTMRKNGRSVEISRLIGRCLRSIVRLDLLGERTIMIDCDVLQADGGTRTACITGAYVALERAVRQWLANRVLRENLLKDAIGAISVGFKNGKPLLDLDFKEDSSTVADFNFVLTKAGSLVEVQGTAEQDPLDWQAFNEVCAVASKGVQDIFAFFDVRDQEKMDGACEKHATKKQSTNSWQQQGYTKAKDRAATAPLFSLQSRLKNNEKA